MLSLDPLKKTCIALAIAQTLAIPAAQAATIIVNTTGDTDGNDQVCTLREAIVSIHDFSPAPKGCNFSGIFGVNDTVGFDPGLNDQVIQLEQGSSLSITKNLTINGLGEDQLTIDRIGPDSRIFNIENATVQINDLKITGGRNAYGGAGIRAINSNLILSNITVSGNISYTNGWDSEYGGGIKAFNSSVSLINCTVSDNSAGLFGGGIFVGTHTGGFSNLSIFNSTISGNSSGPGFNGGGISVGSRTSVSLTNSTVSGNSSGSNGGGISAWGTSNLSLTNSTVSGNSSGSDGGGIFAKVVAGVNLTDSTVSGNSAGKRGGGIHAEDSSEINLYNSTVSSNSAEFGGGIMGHQSSIQAYNSTISNNSVSKSGGGIFTVGNDSFDSVLLQNSSIVGNTADLDGGGIAQIGGLSQFVNSIISGNIAANLGDEIASLEVTFTGNRNNLLGDSSKTNAQAFYSFSPGADITATADGTMPTVLTSILEPMLKNNGGPTETHALVAGSPAINAGDNAICAAEPVNNKDQRGETRPVGNACDIGAFEFGASFFVIPLSNGKTVIFSL